MPSLAKCFPNFQHRVSCNLPGGAPCTTAAAYPIRQSSTTAAYPIRQSVYSSSVLNICLQPALTNSTHYSYQYVLIIFVIDLTAQGVVSASTAWLGIIRRSGTRIGKEQAPDRVLPADTPTHLTH